MMYRVHVRSQQDIVWWKVRLQGGDISSSFFFKNQHSHRTQTQAIQFNRRWLISSQSSVVSHQNFRYCVIYSTKKKEKMNGVRRDHGISLEAVMKDNHLTERKTKVTIFWQSLFLTTKKRTKTTTTDRMYAGSRMLVHRDVDQIDRFGIECGEI